MMMTRKWKLPALVWAGLLFGTVVAVSSFRADKAPDPVEYIYYKLNFKVKDPVVRPDLEAEMLKMINAERKKEGLAPLVADAEMTGLARTHSADMLSRGYFSHYTPEKAGPFDRMKSSLLTYIKAGENLSLAPTVSSAHRELMRSTGHRENILRPVFGRVGIGIMDGGKYGIMVTQDFRN